MKYIRYSKYTGEPADAVDLEELIEAPGRLLPAERLRVAILRRLRIRPRQDHGGAAPGHPARPAEGDLLPEDLLEQLTQRRLRAKRASSCSDLIDRSSSA